MFAREGEHYAEAVARRAGPLYLAGLKRSFIPFQRSSSVSIETLTDVRW